MPYNSGLTSVCPEMRNFFQDRGGRKKLPQAYILYSEDNFFRPTKRLGKMTISGRALTDSFFSDLIMKGLQT